MQYKLFIILIVTLLLINNIQSKKNTQECTNEEQANDCQHFCCGANGFCAEDPLDCKIYGDNHCIFLHCTECCFKEDFNHYCGTEYECKRDSYRSLLVTLIGVLLIPSPFVILLVIRCVKNIKSTAKKSLYEKMHPNDAQELQNIEQLHQQQSVSPINTPYNIKTPVNTDLK